jgi:zinc protease
MTQEDVPGGGSLAGPAGGILEARAQDRFEIGRERDVGAAGGDEIGGDHAEVRHPRAENDRFFIGGGLDRGLALGVRGEGLADEDEVGELHKASQFARRVAEVEVNPLPGRDGAVAAEMGGERDPGEFAEEFALAFGVAWDEERAHRHALGAKLGDEGGEEPLLPRPGGGADEEAVLPAEAQFLPQVETLGGGEDGVGIEVELEVPHRLEAGGEAEGGKAFTVALAGGKDVGEGPQERSGESREAAVASMGTVRHAGVGKDHGDAAAGRLVEVLGPQFTLEEDDEVGPQPAPGGGGAGPAIEGEDAPPDGEPGVALLEDGAAGTGRGGEADFDFGQGREGAQERTEGEQFPDTHGLYPDPFDTFAGRGHVAQPSQPVGEIPTIPAAPPHPPEVPGQGERQGREKTCSIEPDHLVLLHRNLPLLMNKRKASLLVFSLILAPLLPAAPPRPFAHVESDLSPDPAIVFGVLDNGLRYAVLPHQEPPGRVSLRLLVEAGRLEEADDQIGVAHFLEHLMFNGSENFPPGELVKLFQRLGMGFGADTNAYTAFEETVYMFELPDTAEETLEQSFLALRDYADRAFLLPEEIERERGVILAERRDRDNAARRSAEDALRFMFPYGTIADRLNATVEHTLAIEEADLRRFYEDYYSAERLAVVVVGDLDPARAVALIEEHFAGVRANPEPAPAVSRGTLLPRGEAYDVFVDAELTGVEIDLSTVRPHGGEADSSERRRETLSRAAAVAMLNRRLERLAQSETPPFLSAQAYAYEMLDFAEVAGIQANLSEPAGWEQALRAIQLELRRALGHGFTEAELEVFRANRRAALARAVAQAPSRRSRDLAGELVSSISGDTVFLHPAQEEALYGPMLEALTPEEARSALAEAWSDASRLLRIESPEPIDNLYAEMRRAYRGNLSEEVAPPEEALTAEFAYTDFGPAGEIVDRYPLEGLEAEQVVFGNNVVLSLRKTDFEQNRIHVGVRFGGGLLSLAKDQPGLDVLAGFAFTRGGLEAHSLDDLQTILAGRNVNAAFTVDNDAFVLSGVTTPEDLERQLELLAAYVVAPGYRPEAGRQFAQAIPQYYRYLTQTLDGAYRYHVPGWLAGGDPRLGFPAREVLEAHTLEDLAGWLEPALERAKLEVAVVGDLDPEAVVEAVRRTFGALPSRAMTKPDYRAARALSLPPAGSAATFTYATENPKSRLVVVWPTTDRKDIRISRRLSVLAGVIDDRLRERVREEIGEAYSPYAYNTSSETFTDYGYTAAVIDADPASLDLLADLLREIAEGVVAEGVDADEFDRVLRPRLSSLEQQFRDNRYWLNSVLLGSHEQPRQLDWARTLFTDYPTVTREEIEALAREYLGPDRALEIRVIGELGEPTE